MIRCLTCGACGPERIRTACSVERHEDDRSWPVCAACNSDMVEAITACTHCAGQASLDGDDYCADCLAQFYIDEPVEFEDACDRKVFTTDALRAVAARVNAHRAELIRAGEVPATGGPRRAA